MPQTFYEATWDDETLSVDEYRVVREDDRSFRIESGNYLYIVRKSKLAEDGFAQTKAEAMALLRKSLFEEMDGLLRQISMAEKDLAEVRRGITAINGWKEEP